MLNYFKILICVLSWGFSQVNMEYVRAKLETGETAGQISFNFTIREGNSSYWKTEAEAAGGINFLGGHLIGTGKKSDLIVKDETTDSKSFYHVRYVKNIFDIFTNEFFIQLQDNHSNRLKERRLFGGGIRKALINTDMGTMNLGIGLMSESELLTDDSQFSGFRSTNYLSIKSKWSERIHLTSVLYVQPILNDLSDIKVLFDFRPSITISDHFTFMHKTILRYDAMPPESVEKLDYEIIQMIQYQF